MRANPLAWIAVFSLAAPAGAEQGPFRGLPCYEVGDPEAVNPLRGTEGPKSLVAEDLDLDGDLDLATGNLDGSVSVLRNRGDGRFDPQILACAGGSLRGIAAADFTGDGIPDVAAADITGHLILLEGRGDGSLSAAFRFEIENARALAPADFDRDGAMDLAVVAAWPNRRGSEPHDACPPEQLLVLFGAGDGTFDRVVLPTPAWDCLFDLEVADLGGDGRMDILALDQVGERLLVYAGDGARGFRLAQRLDSLGRGPRALCVAYLDERLHDGGAPPDATLDVVIANRESSTLTLFRGRPDGFFEDAHETLHAGAAPRSVAAADMDGDGWNELLVVNRNLNTMTVLHGEGGGRFSIAYEIATGKSPRAVVAADFNGDGAPDAAVASRISSEVRVYPGRLGLAGFQVLAGTYPSGVSPVAVVAEDFDGDGRPDVAVANARSHDLRVRLGRAEGLLGPEAAYGVADNPMRMVSADFNDDGAADVALTCMGSEQGTRGYAREGAVVSLLGRGDGTFEPAVSSPAGERFCRPYAVRAADLDGDGHEDLAVSDTRGRLTLFRGRGDGTFDEGIDKGSLGRRPRPVSIAAGDFDGDGDIDLATSMVKIAVNKGDFFAAEAEIHWKRLPVPLGRPVIIGDHVIEAGDLDEDGILDLVVAITFVSSRPDPIVVYFGHGDGTFDGPYEYPTGQGVTSIAIADFTGDGIADIVTGNRCAASITFLKGLGGGEFERLPDVGLYPVEDLAAGDFNGDGRLDLAGAGCGLWLLINGREPDYKDPEEEHPYGLAIEEGPYINEVMASNLKYTEETLGRTPDWVEIYNHGGAPLDLTGWRFGRSDLEARRQLRFRPGTTIPPKGRLVLYCDGKPGSPREVHAPFKLPREGIELVLVDPEGRTVDRVVIPPQRPDTSFGRIADGARAFAYNPVPSPGLPNTKPANLPPRIRPQGFALDNALRRGGEIETLLECSDETGIQFASVRYVWRRGDGGRGGIQEVPLAYVGPTDWGALFRGTIPMGRPDWDGSLMDISFYAVDFDGRVATMPGDSSDSWFAFVPRVGVSPLRIREVMPGNRSGLQDERGRYPDWLVIQNYGSETVALDGFALAKDVLRSEDWWRFPSGYALAPGEPLLVFCDGDTDEGPLHASFKLNLQGDRIALLRAAEGDPPVPQIVDVIRFEELPEDTAFGIEARDEDPHVLDRPNPPPVSPRIPFVRGNANGDAVVDLADVVGILAAIFGSGRLACFDAADVNDDGLILLNDPILLLDYLFMGGRAPAPPFPDPGLDPTPDGLEGF